VSHSNQIWDHAEISEAIVTVNFVLDIIFSIIISMVMFLAFFSLVSAMSSNIMLQSKEIAILRALGYTKKQIIRLYFYEAFILVVSASTTGIFIGTSVGWVMMLQQTAFLGIPRMFLFPWTHFYIITIVSSICSIIAIYSPSTSILKREISEIF